MPRVFASTLALSTVTVSPVSAVAPKSVYVSMLCSKKTVLFPVNVMNGAIVSLVITVLVLEPSLLEASVAV